MKKAVKDAVEAIKAANFTHIKVEIEGTIGREGERPCEDCDGGSNECDYCDGEGAIDTGDTVGVNNQAVFEECSPCYGEGMHNCDECDGTELVERETETQECENIMLRYMKAETKEALTYGNFYDDGSVDSEYTFTLPVEHVEKVPDVIEAFKKMAKDVNGTGNIDVHGAGLHISVLTEGKYPSRNQLDEVGMLNFRKEVHKLLPAMFFMASSGRQSRSLEYRIPRISKSEKYSAIFTHNNTCIEYRLFETCYDNTDVFFDYLQVIAKTLEFYVEPKKRVQALDKKFVFCAGDNVSRFFDTPEQLRILNGQISEIKPADKSYLRLKRERGIHFNISELQKRKSKKLNSLKKDYKKYVAAFNELRAQPLNEGEERRIDELMRTYDFSRERALIELRGRDKHQTLDEFLARNLPRQRVQDTIAI